MPSKPVKTKLTMKRNKEYKGEYQVYDLFFEGKELLSMITVFSDNSIQLDNYMKNGYTQTTIGGAKIEP